MRPQSPMVLYSRACLNMTKIEILAPAGSFESVTAAVNSGADAVYLGLKDFSARKEAQNFTFEELKATTEYCHIRNVRVYVTMNTLIFDDEMPSALQAVRSACECDIDALIVQDIGFASLVHRACPDLPLHGSTQMSIHTLSGAKLLEELGFKRVVLAREMSGEEIKKIADNTDIELEVFVHGALCMCVSGQCYFSAVLGGRSGNRGFCAQTCRLPFKAGNSTHALSLKDNSIIDQLDELQAMGVTSAKIEGRLKRPEYVASAVRACYEKRENGYISAEAAERLKNVFSRTGFTNGYYMGKTGKDMFGFRKKENVISATEGLLKEIRNSCREELSRVPLTGKFSVNIGEVPKFCISDGINSVIIEGETRAEPAVRFSLTAEKAEAQLAKTGGTPFYFENIQVYVQEGTSIPLSMLNKLRRTALAELEKKRSRVHDYHFTMLELSFAPTRQFILEKRAEVKLLECDGLDGYSLVFVPIDISDEEIKNLRERNIRIGISIPRGLFGREEKIIARLEELKQKGITDVLCQNLGAVYFCKQLGLKLHGGEFLNFTNTYSLMWAEEYGFEDALVSIELTDSRINRMGGKLKRGVVSYGYIPLMLTRNCPMKSGGISCSTCKKQGKITDRKGIDFALACDGVCVEVLNSVVLDINSKLKNGFSVCFNMEKLYVENSVENVKNSAERRSYKNMKNPDQMQKTHSTNGMYFRGVK